MSLYIFIVVIGRRAAALAPRHVRAHTALRLAAALVCRLSQNFVQSYTILL